MCRDTGMEIIEGVGARACVCRVKRIRDKRLSVIPPAFRDVRLGDLVAMPDVHRMQSEAVPFVQAHPEMSYLLAGRFGTGKTMLMWALYRDAVDRGVDRVVICTAKALMDEIRAYGLGGGVVPRVSGESLRQSDVRWSLFIDDLDKDKASEYANSQLFEIVNAAYEYKHQIVVTTNLDVAGLVEHFDKEDERFGGAIVRRIVDGAKVYEMF